MGRRGHLLGVQLFATFPVLIVEKADVFDLLCEVTNSFSLNVLDNLVEILLFLFQVIGPTFNCL